MNYTIPKGFRVFAVKSGISTKDKPDLGLIISERPAEYAGVFTKNLFPAAPVIYCKKMLGKKIDAVIVNSGCANACTGKEGYKDIEKTVAYFKNRFNNDPLTAPLPSGERIRVRGEGDVNNLRKNVLMCSTGVIGHRLPMEKVMSGIDMISVNDVGKRGGIVSDSDIEQFERAIMTTDTKLKIYFKKINEKGKSYSILGFAKGSGMIHPDMGTMLSFIVTDARCPAALLKGVVSRASEKTFNRISVDGDTSTNDSAILLANGMSDFNINAKNINGFEKEVYGCMRHLAKAIAADGEGATKLIRILIKGIDSIAAKKMASQIATSPLVKTAIYGSDPNWGRIIASIGHSGAKLDAGKIRLFIQGVPVFRNNMPLGFDEKELSKKISEKEVEIRIECGGRGETLEFFTCDLTEEYIKINALYRT